MNASGSLQLIGALVVTLGALGLAIHFLRRLQRGAVGREASGVPLRLVKRISVGPKQGIGLLRVADRVLVVSLAESGAQLLTELPSSVLDNVEEGGEPPKGPHRWSLRVPLIGRIMLLAALLSAPLSLEAQTAPAPAKGKVAAQSAGPLVKGPQPPRVEVRIGEGSDQLQLSGAVGLVVFFGVMTLLPALFLLMTSFTRILIVLHFLRTAIGVHTTPPGQLLAAMAILLTGVVMSPVLQETNHLALQPYLEGHISQIEAYQAGVVPFRNFMLNQTRDQDLAMFTEMSHVQDAKSMDDIPTVTIVSAFITSELRTAFQMGFVIFLPFVVMDVIVASVLMSLGMFMLPPPMISLPFKLLLFVLADGWTLVFQNLVSSFH